MASGYGHSSSSSMSSTLLCVSPSPAGPVDCHPLNFLNLVNLGLRVRVPNVYQSFVCNFFSTLRCKSQVLTKYLSFFKNRGNFIDMLTISHGNSILFLSVMPRGVTVVNIYVVDALLNIT